MSSTTTPACPQCGKPLPANSPGGLCPRCLMALNMATQTVLSGEGADAQSTPKPAPPTPEEIAEQFPNFDILGCLGRGGMGVVYKARQKSLNRLVALKILAPERERDAAFAQRFALEAETLAKLNHPGIVTIYDFGQTDGLFYLVMEFVDGVSLRHLLEAGRVSPREALAIVPQICDALQYAHDQRIVHRDIKPENILLDRQGRVKVADFGLAKLVEMDAGGVPLTPPPFSSGARRVPALTEAGKVMGTPQYMAPEQRQHPTEVDHRADIYSLGVVFYQMLTGGLPDQPIEPPSRKVRIDVRLDEVVPRALEKEPERRYQQVSQVKTDVETIRTTPTQGAAGSSATAQPLSFEFGTWGRLEAARWSARLLGLSLLLFIGVIFGLILFGVGLPPLALQSEGTLLNHLAIALIALGFVLGWKLEGTAAVLIAAGWALWHSSNGSLAWSMFHLALLVAALYALCWWATQGRRTLVLVTVAGVMVTLLVCGMVFLPTNIYLYGTVVDTVTHRPIPNAELIVFRVPFAPSGPKSPAAARSLPSGYYALHVGWYTPGKQVRVTAPGHAPFEMVLSPKPLGTRRIQHDFVLSPVPMTPKNETRP